ncbi:N-lysine methyltransferase KMT5A-like [Hydra vulgaris]|uniref:N-lysine methyltransferase KMT5A-like n=1 Tax=Hydra vulgaris TaxID=6087 RepID=UPI0032EA0227
MQKDPDTLYKKEVDKTKGFGVFSFEKIQKGQFIAQYRGDLVPKKEMNNKIQYYEKTNAGSYVYDFLHNNIEYSIDATFHFNYIGRYFNDSKYYPNAIMKKVVLNNTPSLCLFALKDIEPNEEILYFYGVDNLIWHTEELKRKNQKRNKSKVNH